MAGCWDQLPFPNRAEVLVISVRPARHPGQYRWTFYFPNPTVTVRSVSSLKPTDQLYADSADAATLAQAFALEEQQTSRSLYLGSVEDLAWSTQVPTAEVVQLMDGYTRDGLLPKSAYVVVSAESLDKVLTPLPQEVVPAIYLTRFFACSQCQAIMLTEQQWKLWDSIWTPGISPVVPTVSTQGTVDELSVYRSVGKPVLFNPIETIGWAYLMGKVHRESATVKLPSGYASVSGLRSASITDVRRQGRHLVVRATIKVTGAVAQWPQPAPLTPEDVTFLQMRAARAVLDQCLAAIQRGDATHTDPFGFARTYDYQHPGEPPLPADTPYVAHLAVSVTLQGTGNTT
jgi:hypothetical protein